MRIDWLIRFGVVITVILLASAFLFSLSDTCSVVADKPEPVCEMRLIAFWYAPANEVGDTLAGLAGALAFLWLVLTVFLQGKELNAQRQELSLTRMEMKEQRLATQDMARSMAAQAKIFEDEQRARDEERAECLLNEKLRSLIVSISESRRVGLGWHFSNQPFDEEYGSYGEVVSRHFDDESNMDKTIDDAVLSLRRKLNGFRDDIWELIHMSVDYRLPKRTQQVPELAEKIDGILKLRSTLSLPQQERLDRMKLSEIRESMFEVYEQLELWEMRTQ